MKRPDLCCHPGAVLLSKCSSPAGGTAQGVFNPAVPGAIGGTTPAAGAFTTLSATGQITSTLAGGTAPFAVTSTTAVANLTVSNHAKVQSCGASSTCSHTAETGSQIVYGSAPLVSGSPSAVTVTGISPAFTSSSTYSCAVSDDTTAIATGLVLTYVSGSSFTVTGPATSSDVVSYVCVGT